MEANPVLKKLGLSPDDRVAIIHTDDIGMCQASVDAFADLWEVGLISSGAVMMPCPWAVEAAKYAQQHPDADLGIHLTLTSEWQTYRWRPLSTVDRASGLFDEEGFLWRRSEGTQEHADPEAVNVEMAVQIEAGRAAGLVPTHADTHMGTVAHPRFIAGYLQTAIRHGLPPMMARKSKEGWIAFGLDEATAAMAAEVVSGLEAQGIPLLDDIGGLDLDEVSDPTERIAYAKQQLDDLKPGVTHFIIHPSKDTPELRAITPDWPYRVADYRAFTDEGLKQWVAEQGIHVIGYRDIQNLMPGQ